MLKRAVVVELDAGVLVVVPDPALVEDEPQLGVGMVKVKANCVGAVTGPGSVIVVMEAGRETSTVCRGRRVSAVFLTRMPTAPATASVAASRAGSVTVGRSRVLVIMLRSLVGPSRTVLTVSMSCVTRFAAAGVVTAFGSVMETSEVMPGRILVTTSGTSVVNAGMMLAIVGIMLVTAGMMLVMAGTTLVTAGMMLVNAGTMVIVAGWTLVTVTLDGRDV